MKKLLCKLGLHTWAPTKTLEDGLPGPRTCTTCGKTQHLRRDTNYYGKRYHWVDEETQQTENCKRRCELASALETRIQEVESQLPEGMKHCTIVFKECDKGHGWLTATNWVQHGCPTCELATESTSIRAERDDLKDKYFHLLARSDKRKAEIDQLKTELAITKKRLAAWEAKTDQRELGRREALQLLTAIRPDELMETYAINVPIADTGDYTTAWDDKKLNTLFDIDKDESIVEHLTKEFDNLYWGEYMPLKNGFTTPK